MAQSAIVREQAGDLVYYRVASFAQAGAVTAAFSTRLGGVSEGKLSGLNLGFAKPEPRANVQENYRRFLSALHLPPEKIVLTVQKHTDILLEDAHRYVGHGWDSDAQIVADAEMTDQPGCVLVKLTADCVPVLLYAPDVHAIAAVHDGWRSTVQKLAQKTALAMCRRYHADPSKMLAAIGPSIGSCCFEIDELVADLFCDAFSSDILHQTAPHKWHADLWECNIRQLVDAGLKRENISLCGICTKCADPPIFYSYRREGAPCGSLAAVIALNE